VPLPELAVPAQVQCTPCLPSTTSTFPPTTSTQQTTTPTAPPLRPTLICPANASVTCQDSTAPSNTGFPQLLDCPGVVPTFVDVRINATNSSCAPFSPCALIERTWSAIGCPNVNRLCCSQFINVSDPSPPLIQCPADVTIDCGAPTSPYLVGFPTGSSQCPPVTFRISAQDRSPSVCGQTILREWTAASACNLTSVCVQRIVVRPYVVPPTIPPTGPPGCSCSKSNPYCKDPVCNQQTAASAENADAGEPDQTVEFLFQGMFSGFGGRPRLTKPKKPHCQSTPFGVYCPGCCQN